jgi:hypothetical protein
MLFFPSCDKSRGIKQGSVEILSATVKYVFKKMLHFITVY